VLDDPPHILNMSLTGPFDPLLERLLDAVQSAGVVIVAARPAKLSERNHFPASLDTVISVGNSEQRHSKPGVATRTSTDIYAPGNQIVVAVPNDSYGFRSGSSLAAAHVSGAIALLLAVSPDLPFTSVLDYLQRSQDAQVSEAISINACIILQLADPSRICQ
jgi:subtilisin family serine protease